MTKIHEKSIIECSNCASTNIIVNKHLYKCLDCGETFLKSEKTRAFNCSSLEKEFQDSYVMQYRGYNIYTYENLLDELKYTFWYSSEDADYVSSKDSLIDAKESIDKIIKGN